MKTSDSVARRIELATVELGISIRQAVNELTECTAMQLTPNLTKMNNDARTNI